MARTEVRDKKSAIVSMQHPTAFSRLCFSRSTHAGMVEAHGQQGRLGEKVGSSQNIQGRDEQASDEFPRYRGKPVCLSQLLLMRQDCMLAVHALHCAKLP